MGGALGVKRAARLLHLPFEWGLASGHFALILSLCCVCWCWCRTQPGWARASTSSSIPPFIRLQASLVVVDGLLEYHGMHCALWDWSRVVVVVELSWSRSSCLVSLECTLGGLFLAHAAAGLHCTVRSITPPWAGCSGLMHLNHLGALCGSYTCVARPRL